MPVGGAGQVHDTRFVPALEGGRCARRLSDFKILVLLSGFCALLYGVGLVAVPVLDRDEARFAQATYQMIESGDYWRISFQDELRTKKPHGIHWLQATAVQVLSDPAAKEIWAYRIPSAIGAWLSVLLVFAIGKDLFGRDVAILSALLLGAAPVLIAEGHIATADAMLLATIIAAQWPLARTYLSARGGPPVASAMVLLFWFAVVAAALVKGPVGPAIVAMTAISLSIADRSVGWLRPLRPIIGIVGVALVIAAYAWRAALANDGGFVSASLGQDFLPKLFSGQESHGAPPGLHLLIAPLALGAAMPFAVVGLWRALRTRSDPAVRFLLAWLVPGWVLFEIVATKLPHYTMPLYPVLALLAAAAACENWLERGKARTLLIAWSALIALALACAVAYLAFPAWQFALPSSDIVALVCLNLLASVGVLVLAVRGQPRRALYVSLAATLVTACIAIGAAIPRIETFWITERIRAAVAERVGGAGHRMVSVGYHEPSLVFRMGTSTLLTGAQEAADAARADPQAVIAIDSRQRALFDDLTRRQGLFRPPPTSVEGFNYTNGEMLTIWLYVP